MDPFNAAPDIIIDLVFRQLNEDDLHETLRVSKTWFWASIRRIKKLKIAFLYNPLESMAEFYNKHRGSADQINWPDFFKHLVLDELIVNHHNETKDYILENGCNTAKLTIKTSNKSTPVTLAFLKKVHRLQSFEFCTFGSSNWHPFIAECIRSSNSGFDFNIECLIQAMKLNSCGWKSEDPVLHSVTKLGFRNVTIQFLRALVNLCPNLEELHCSNGVITQDWRKVFPPNIKRIGLHDVSVDDDVATIVDASTDSARHLLPYLCQNWESVEKFHLDGYINIIGRIEYEAFPQKREEVLVCEEFNEATNLASPLFQSREIRVKCDGRKALELSIPPAKRVKLEFIAELHFKFSPRDVCIEPGKVEHLSLSLPSAKGFTPMPFGPSSFAEFSRLTSLSLSHVSALNIEVALDQCPFIKKLELKNLKAFTISTMPRKSSYANVSELVLGKCEETIWKVFQVFPCLLQFNHSISRDCQGITGKPLLCFLILTNIHITDWLWRYLITKHKMYGVVFESTTEIRYIFSDDLQASVSQAQKLLSEFRNCECYLKGFKLIPRFPKQKVIYIN